MREADFTAENEKAKRKTRREFLNYFIGVGFGVVGAAFAYPIIRYVWPSAGETREGGRVEVGPAEDIPEGAGSKVVYKGKPTWVIRAPFGFVALSAVCTHLGCIVEYDAEREIWCPCHAAFFDLRGNV
ncbi:MAG: ubiquinol-cytochrome c reductase iron-sulfur subunit, partial [Candidatus Coatesbacteria bacterium]